MHLLYVDESGGDDPNPRIGILCWAEFQPLNASRTSFPGMSTISGNTFSRKNRAHRIPRVCHLEWQWKPVASYGKIQTGLIDGPDLQAHSTGMKGVALFGIVLEKNEMPNVGPIQKTCEEMAGHFDVYSMRLEAERNADKQRGLMIFDRSRYEKTVQALMTEFRTTGASFGKVRRMAEVPLFTDSKITRMLQIADFVAYAIYRRFESSDARLFDMILPRFVESERTIHGLVHLNGYRQCYCPACLTRRIAVTTSTQLTLGLPPMPL